jgi:UPF0755 protein
LAPRNPQWRGRLVLALLVLLVTLRLSQMAVTETYNGPGPLLVSRNVVIPEGGSQTAAAALQHDGAIKWPFAFRLAARFTRDAGPLRAGEFFIPARSSMRDILAVLRFSPPVEHQVTFPEGLTAKQIAQILNAAPEAAGQVAPPPEGAVLPQTYDYTRGTARQKILDRAEAAMDAALETAWAARDRRIILTSPFQALVLASIVQAETPVEAELPDVAAVYENRLGLGMKLQADPTVIFAASGGTRSGGAAINRADLANPSPYNTYAWSGLPPGPICAPGLLAITAVLHPAASAALYFVATGAGGHVFTDDFNQQLANIARYHAAIGK